MAFFYYMPWHKKDSLKYHKGLTSIQQTKWAEVANTVLKECLIDGGKQSECEGKAIRLANSIVNKMKSKGENIMKTRFEGKMRIIAETDPILERTLTENPVLRAIHQTANGKIAVMDAVSIGQEGYPTIPAEVLAQVGNGPWVYDRDIVQKALPTIFGKPVVIEASMQGHGDKITRLTIGSIVGAEIYTDDRGEFVRVFPVLWDSEYPEIIEEIKANKEGLSTSFEMDVATDKILVQAGQVKPQAFTFSGSCILKRANAAYPGQNITAIAHSTEATKEPSFHEISKMIYSALADSVDGQDKWIVEIFPSSVIYSTVKDGKYWKSNYTIENDNVTLNKPIEVKPTYIKATKSSPDKGDMGTHLPDVGTTRKDRQRNKNTSKGGKTYMFANIPTEYHEEVQKILDEANAVIKAEYDAKLQDEVTKYGDLKEKVNDLQAEVSASKKLELIKASYPVDKVGEILDVLKKVELKTATSDEVLKLSTLVVVAEAKKDLIIGNGNPGKYTEKQLDTMFGIKAKKSV